MICMDAWCNAARRMYGKVLMFDITPTSSTTGDCCHHTSQHPACDWVKQNALHPVEQPRHRGAPPRRAHSGSVPTKSGQSLQRLIDRPAMALEPSIDRLRESARTHTRTLSGGTHHSVHRKHCGHPDVRVSKWRGVHKRALHTHAPHRYFCQRTLHGAVSFCRSMHKHELFTRTPTRTPRHVPTGRRLPPPGSHLPFAPPSCVKAMSI
jgi:hypothetical protein